MSPSHHSELRRLLEALCEATITDEQFAQLQTLLRDVPEARVMYIEYMTFAADLKRTLSACSGPMSDPLVGPDSPDPDEPRREKVSADAAPVSNPYAPRSVADQTSWEITARQETIRTHAEQLFERFKSSEMRRQQELAYKQYRAQRRKLFIGMGSLVALLVLVLAVWLLGPGASVPEPETAPPTPPPPPVVARITRSLSAQWLSEERPTEPGTAFTPAAMFLTQGLVELAFDGGTEVIVQAPANLQLEDVDQLFLRSGTISARITEGSTGFIVRTPTGTVVDYGTEFGVIVNHRGETEALVYEGKVGLRSGSDPVRSVASRMLEEGQAGAVDTTGRVIGREFHPRQVIREMPEEISFGIPGKRFDLADALVGGNGFGTGDPNQIVDIRTGTISLIRGDSANRNSKEIRGTRPPSLPLVDFLFAADGSAPSVPVSSAGHQFTECPDTDGSAYTYVSNSGFLRHIPGVLAELVLDGHRYGTQAEPAICIHANAGITFDLQAIGATFPGTRIGRFTALCGISETAGQAKEQEQGDTWRHRADLWILVDGRVRFSRRRLRIGSSATPVSVALEGTDRFLSLVVTDGGDGNGYDWGVFAKPALELSQDERTNRLSHGVTGLKND